MTRQEYNTSVDIYSDRVYRFIVKNLKNSEDARDIVQNAYVKLWIHHQQVEFKKARSYLFTVAYRNMIDFIRKSKRMDIVAVLPERIQPAAANNFELKDQLNLSLAQLTEVQRSVILLRDYEGYSYKEIATITHLSEAQVKVYIYRARKKLQSIIGSIEQVI